MTDATTNPQPTEAPLPAGLKEPIAAGGQIAALVPQNIEQTVRLAQALASSGDMIPETFRGNWQKIMAAVIKGMEVGLAPMQALASIAVINGRPAIWGDAIAALVQRAGHNLDVVMEGEGETLTAVATLTRANGIKIVRSFSVDDAKIAKLWNKPGVWQQYPSRMLMMRARAFAARDGAADALMGMQIADEVAEYGPAYARDVTPHAAAPRRGSAIYREIDPPQQPEIVDVGVQVADEGSLFDSVENGGGEAQ